MEDPKVIYLGPACQKEGDGREWCEDDVWPQCECGCSSVRYVLESVAQSELTALKAELASEEQDHAELRDVVGSLREELAGLQSSCAIDRRHLDRMIEHSDDLQQRLTAAEQRNAALAAMVFRLASKGSEVPGFPASLMREARLLIKPTESGASE